jgi:hypothetical protein
MEGILEGVGLWKERKEWKEDGRNVGQCRIMEGKKEITGKEDGRNAGQCRVVEGKKVIGG